MVDGQLEKIHSLELLIAIELKRICDENNIKYYLIAGTLLGAVRHGGFIPWDDDMDIGMLRDDYERFIEICKTELSSKYFLQTWDNDKNYAFSYAKLRLNNTKIVECFSNGVDVHQGIFIDIFPFDNVPKSKLNQKIQSKIHFLFKRLLWIKKGYGKNLLESSDFKQRIKYKIYYNISKLMNYEKMKQKYKKILTKYNTINKNSEWIVADGSYSYEKESIKRCWFNELTMFNFENTQFLSTVNYNEYLKHMYKDYMKLPSPDKQKTHELIIVDFGSY